MVSHAGDCLDASGTASGGIAVTAPQGASSRPRLSVLIVSWNQGERLATCLGAVRRFLPEAQTVVVDNGSFPSLPRVEGVSVWVRSECNLGYAGGSNLGFSRCEGEFVLLLNNDAVLPSARPVEALLRFMRVHPRVAAAQAKLVLPDGTLDACGEFLTPAGVLYHHGYRLPDGPHAARPFPVFAGKGACLLLRRLAVGGVGNVLFRQGFFCYYEDIDFCHRLWLAGYEVWFVPDEPVFHDEGTSARLHASRDVWRHYLSNMLASALDLWGIRAWLTMGPGFLFFLLAGAACKGVWFRPSMSRIAFRRVRSERDLLRRVTVRVPLRYYWAMVRRRFGRLRPCALPVAKGD